MNCKNCKEDMDEDERGNEDGLVTVIRICHECGWSCKSWYDLDECMSSNDGWLNDKGKEPTDK